MYPILGAVGNPTKIHVGQNVQETASSSLVLIIVATGSTLLLSYSGLVSGSWKHIVRGETRARPQPGDEPLDDSSCQTLGSRQKWWIWRDNGVVFDRSTRNEPRFLDLSRR
jgi:hypothetical protein